MKTHCSLRQRKPSSLMNPVEARMDFITDTHSLVWYFTKDARLSTEAFKAFEGTIKEGRVVVPAVVLAEIMYIYSKRLRF
mgnify:CR=1 FL=1